MKVTNKMGLPETIVKAVSNQRPPEEGVLHVSDLIAPPLQVALRRAHYDDIVEDASDRIWLAFGSLMHGLLAENAGPGVMVEETFTTCVPPWTITGTVDYYRDRVLSDYKTTSVWSIINGVKPEWVNQVHLYAELLTRNGWPVERAEIVVILRDWSRSKAKQGGNYPQSNVVILPVPLWDQLERKGTLHHLVDLHWTASEALIEDIPVCTPEERWQDPPVFAVMKEGRKRAVKLFKGETARGQANTYAWESATPDLYTVVERPSVPRRCTDYCNVNKWCPWWQENKPEEVA